MIFQHIDFHNVEELQECDKGYAMLRVPAALREQLNEGARNIVSRYSTGIELRFKLIGDSGEIAGRWSAVMKESGIRS